MSRRWVGSAALLAAAALSTMSGVAGAGALTASASSAKAQAQKDLLTLKDMPKGWTKESGNANSQQGAFPGAGPLASCIGKPALPNPPEVDTPYFQNKGGSLEVQDSVSIFGSAKKAATAFSLLTNSKTPGCLAQFMNGQYKSQIAAAGGEGTTVGTITITRTPTGPYGKGTSGYSMKIPVTSQGQTLTINSTAVFFLKGNLGQQITFNTYGSTFSTSLTRHIVSVAMQRL